MRCFQDVDFEKALGNSLLPRKSWRCVRFHQQLGWSNFDGHLNPFTFFGIELLKVQVHLWISKAYWVVKFLLRFAQCLDICLTRDCACHFLSSLSTFVAWIRELSRADSPYSTGVLLLFRSGLLSSAGERSCSEHRAHKFYYLYRFRFFVACHNGRVGLTCHDEGRYHNRQGVLDLVAFKVYKRSDEIGLSCFLAEGHTTLSRKRQLDCNVPLTRTALPAVLFASLSTGCSWWMRLVWGFLFLIVLRVRPLGQLAVTWATMSSPPIPVITMATIETFRCIH